MDDVDDEPRGTPGHGQLSSTERTIAEVWSEVLQMDGLPNAGDDFFALGGDSMQMVMAEFRIMEELAVQLPAAALLGAPTVRELSLLVDSTRAECSMGH